MPRPATLWTTMTLRIPPQAEVVIRAAEKRFYLESNRPPTDPVALGWMVEQLCADYLAGPASPHPGAAIRRELAALRDLVHDVDAVGSSTVDPTKETG